MNYNESKSQEHQRIVGKKFKHKGSGVIRIVVEVSFQHDKDVVIFMKDEKRIPWELSKFLGEHSLFE